MKAGLSLKYTKRQWARIATKAGLNLKDRDPKIVHVHCPDVRHPTSSARHGCLQTSPSHVIFNSFRLSCTSVRTVEIIPVDFIVLIFAFHRQTIPTVSQKSARFHLGRVIVGGIAQIKSCLRTCPGSCFETGTGVSVVHNIFDDRFSMVVLLSATVGSAPIVFFFCVWHGSVRRSLQSAF